MKMALEVWSSFLRLSDVLLDSGPISFGRNQQCTFATEDPRCSGRHLTIARSAEGVATLQDHSSNGTFLNGVRVTKNEVRMRTRVARSTGIGGAALCRADAFCDSLAARRWWCSRMAIS